MLPSFCLRTSVALGLLAVNHDVLQYGRGAAIGFVPGIPRWGDSR